MSVWLLVRVCLLVWAMIFGSVLAQSPRTGGGITPIDPKTGIKGGIQAVTPKESNQKQPTTTQPNRPMVKHPTAKQSDFGFRFTENKGQWGKNVSYRVQLPDGKLSLEKNRFIYDLVNAEDLHKLHEASHGHSHDALAKKAKKEEPVKVRNHVFSVSFEGANANPTLSALDRYSDYENYFVGNDPSQWASGVYSYKVVKYRGLYNGIDLKMYTHEKNIKYDFIVAPGSSPEQIRMKYSGANKIYLSKGALKIKTSIKELTEYIPLAYQEKNGQRLTVACTYKVVSDSIVTFELTEGYDRSLPLVIDPTLVYATYSGETETFYGYAATYDKDGNLYSAGQLDFHICIKKFDTSIGGGGELVWTSHMMRFNYFEYYIGGGSADWPHSMVCSKNGELFVLTTTNYSNYPPSYPNLILDPEMITGGIDVVVYKLDKTGILVKSFLIGGEGSDGRSFTTWRGESGAGEIILSTNEQYVYATFGTQSTRIINGSSDTTKGGYDALVVKLPADLSELTWHKFIGGTGDDDGRGIRVTADGTIYICGTTQSSSIIGATVGHDSQLDGQRDGYLLRIKDGALKYTYIGGTGEDRALLLDIDEAGNVYVTGQIYNYEGNDPNHFETKVAAGENQIYARGLGINGGKQFIRKYSPDLNTLIFSSVWGTNTAQLPNIDIKGFMVDRCENIYVYGWGGIVNNFQAGTTGGLEYSSDALERGNHGKLTDGSDLYLMCLNKNAMSVSYATFLGIYKIDNINGDHCHNGMSRFDKNGFLYIAGCVPEGESITITRDFNAEEGIIKASSVTNNNPIVDLYSVKFSFGLLFNPTFSFNVGVPDRCSQSVEVYFQNTTVLPRGKEASYEWDFGDDTPKVTAAHPAHQYARTGTYKVKVKATPVGENVDFCQIAEVEQEVTIKTERDNTGTLLTDVSGTLFCIGNWKANFESACLYQYYWLQISDENGVFAPPPIPTNPPPADPRTAILPFPTGSRLSNGPDGPTNTGTFTPPGQPLNQPPVNKTCKTTYRVRPISYLQEGNMWITIFGASFPINQ